MANAGANNSPVSVFISTLPDDVSNPAVSEELPSEEEPSEEQLVKEELDRRCAMPWWKRPSPWWFLILTPSLAQMPVLAGTPPTFELVNQIVCYALRPEYAAGSISSFAAPDPKLCGADPVVQAAVTKLITVLTMTAGILGCLTTAWWGSRSDRKGRLSVAGATSIGLVIHDIVFVLVFLFSARVKGGHWLLVLGIAVQGLSGGTSAMTSSIYAYISDCIEPAERSGLFSLFLGAQSVGVAVGPIISSLIVRYTHNPLNVFYFVLASHTTYACLVWFVVPESLTKTQMRISHRKHAERVFDNRAGLFARMFQFLAPLLLLIPKRVNHGLKTRVDWNLALVGLSFGLLHLLSSCVPYVFQYATAYFHWSSEILGYWMSIVGISQMVFLGLVLPAIIKVSQQATSAKTQPLVDPESEPLLPKPAKTENVQQHAPSIDLNIARASLIISLVAYFCMSTVKTGGMFTISTILETWGTGSYPALQSLALAVYTSRGGAESGSLFGALSVVQVLCAQVVGPTVFGITYASAALPTMMFFVCMAIAFCTLLLLAFVRLPKGGDDELVAAQEVEAELAHGREEVVV